MYTTKTVSHQFIRSKAFLQTTVFDIVQVVDVASSVYWANFLNQFSIDSLQNIPAVFSQLEVLKANIFNQAYIGTFFSLSFCPKRNQLRTKQVLNQTNYRDVNIQSIALNHFNQKKIIAVNNTMSEEYVQFLEIFITFFGAEDQQDAALAFTELFAYLYQSRVQSSDQRILVY